MDPSDHGYTEYDPSTGAVIEQIQDVNTSDTGDFSDKPSGWATPEGGGLNLVTSYVVDNLGRVKSSRPTPTAPWITFSALT